MLLALAPLTRVSVCIDFKHLGVSACVLFERLLRRQKSVKATRYLQLFITRSRFLLHYRENAQRVDKLGVNKTNASYAIRGRLFMSLSLRYKHENYCTGRRVVPSAFVSTQLHHGIMNSVFVLEIAKKSVDKCFAKYYFSVLFITNDMQEM